MIHRSDQRNRRCRLASPRVGQSANWIPERLEPRTLLTAAFAEVGLLNLAQPDADRWATVEFQGEYDQPVVIAQTLSTNGGQPATIRIRNVTPDGFEVRIEEWTYLDGLHLEETFGYLVVESGVHLAEDGTRIEAGITTASSRWSAIDFQAGFDGLPLVFAQSQSAFEADPITTRIRKVSGTQFHAKLQEEEGLGQHGEESFGYIAVMPGAGALNGVPFFAGRTDDVVKNGWFNLELDPSVPNPEQAVFFGAMQTTDGGDTAGLRYRNLKTDQVQIRIQEEQSRDQERGHTTEVVGFLRFNSPGVFGLGDVEVQGQENLLINGGFEAPTLPGKGWAIFDAIPGWRLVDNPEGLHFEIQRGILGGASEGHQHLELDGDQNGPGTSLLPEELGSVTIGQSVETIPGAQYTLTFAFAGRPNRSIEDNVLGLKIFALGVNGQADPIDFQLWDAWGQEQQSPLSLPGDSGWRYYTTTFTASGINTEIRFADEGISNTFGTFLDDVDLRLVHLPRIEAEIDVFPGSIENPVNLANDTLIEVAILTNNQLDAMTVRSVSTRFAGGEPVLVRSEDINRDGPLDMILSYQPGQTNLRDTYANLIAADINADGVLDENAYRVGVRLTGETEDGVDIVGTEQVRIFLVGDALDELIQELCDAGRITC